MTLSLVSRPRECFPEPEQPDFGPHLHAADRIDWLRRSGMGRAVALRSFMNRNLAALPAECALSLCQRLEPAWDKAAYFEMIVGRFLQLVGATLTYEPDSADDRHVDFLAAFRSGSVFVEATSPEYNREGVARAAHREPLLDILTDEAPHGWSIRVEQLPNHGPDDSRKAFRRTVRALLADLPDQATADQEPVIKAEFPNGRLVMRLRRGRPDGADPLASYPGPSFVGNTRDEISRAVRRKRDQARAFHQLGPVMLALDSGFWTDDDDFDLALFGGTHVTIGADGETHTSSFDATGAFATQRAAEFAGALVFVDLGFVSGPDPLLYLHPRFVGDLPSELGVLERRELTDDGIRVVPATETGVLERLPFVSRAEFEKM